MIKQEEFENSDKLIIQFIVFNVTWFGNYLNNKDYIIDMDQEISSYPKIYELIDNLSEEEELIFIERIDSNPELEFAIKWLELAHDALVAVIDPGLIKLIVKVLIEKDDLELQNLLLCRAFFDMKDLNENDKHKAILINLFDILKAFGKIEIGEFPNTKIKREEGK